MENSKGPWSIAFTALLLLAGLLLLGGCRKPAPLADGSVRLEALVSLHPEQPMLADLDRRLQILLVQREHVLGQGHPANPPAAVEQPTPMLPALPEPKPSPQLDRNTEQFFAQRLDAYTQLLNRDRTRKITLAKRDQLDKIAAEQAKQRAALKLGAEEQRKQVQQEFYITLLNAKIALSAAQERAKSGSSNLAQKRLEEARTQYDRTNNACQARLAKVDAKLKADIQAAEAVIQQRYDAELAEYGRQLEKANIESIARKREELNAESDRDVAAHVAPPMPSQPVPPGKLVLEAPGLEKQFQQSGLANERDRQAALRDVEQVIAALLRERQQLQVHIARDTRDAVAAVAVQHGYRAHFDGVHGPDITRQARAWLGAYWTP